MTINTGLAWLLATGDGWYDIRTIALLVALYGILYLWVGPTLQRSYWRLGIDRQMRHLRMAGWRRLRVWHPGHHIRRLLPLPQLESQRELWTCRWDRYAALLLLAFVLTGVDIGLLWGLLPRLTIASGLPVELGIVVALLLWTAGGGVTSVEQRFATGWLLGGLWLAGQPWLALLVPLLAYVGAGCVVTLFRVLERIAPTHDPVRV